MAKATNIIRWSPYNACDFVVCANDVRIYSLSFKQKSTLVRLSDLHEQQPQPLTPAQVDPAPNDSSHVGDQKWLSLVCVRPELQHVRCFSWCPDRREQHLIAVGNASGKVVLTSLRHDAACSKQFVPPSRRKSNALAWNRTITTNLAVALDRQRATGHGVLVWDISQQGEPVAAPLGESISTTALADDSSSSSSSMQKISSTAESSFNIAPHDAGFSITTPISELCQGEGAVALEWLPDTPTAIAVGTPSRQLRIFDIRSRSGSSSSSSVIAVGTPSRQLRIFDIRSRSGSSSSSSVFTTNNSDFLSMNVAACSRGPVNGVTFDPFNQRRLITFGDDGIVKVWDIRRLKEPTIALSTNDRHLLSVAWCPTRSGVVATTSRDYPGVKVWDLKAIESNAASSSSSSSSGGGGG
eukprot:CAMPEP_0198369016 /NCGR_PEP_ID=MMETSP1450-20131203/155996_1 /TAXON_ID=753684 ORGANISM="Madagascaria erythrocladiodes, Strain CCMP3234" /NCGR_SAMPLE_ID=MMETSP1450 /ASSEMBLY_ACC=CAM_ASM_001115 /LENGTH=410 /DNA_ID=CAMNT_0044076533 /DNA_START=38 /DNA_END=1266 /DNA_ORIENTATION=-